MAERLFLIDTFGFIFRAYHARARTGAPPMRASRGISTEAVYIFHNMLKKLLTEWKPEHVAAIYESDGPGLRVQQFAGYKANRTAMPPDLAEQIPWVRTVIEAFRIPVLEFDGYEADDVIGTMSRRATERGYEVVIVSSDKDMLQLVNDRVSMLNLMKADPPSDSTFYNPAKVQQFMRVPPERVADLLALKGDSVDNIPGAPGIGDKGAVELISQYGDVENVLAHAADVKRKAYRESLENNAELVRISKRLATIACDIPMEIDWTALTLETPDTAKLREVYRELEFFSFLKELPLESQPEGNYRSVDAPDAIPLVDPIAVVVGRTDSLNGMQLGLSVDPAEGLSASGDTAAAILKDLLEGERSLIVEDLKSLLHGQEVKNLARIADVSLLGFLVTADPGTATLDGLAGRLLEQRPGATPESRAVALLALHRKLEPEVAALAAVYREIDLPTAAVLVRMEKAGIRVNRDRLGDIGVRLDAEMESLSLQIFGLSNKPFNINSPQQLSKVLFEDLGIAPPGGGRGGKKQVSTAADVLEALAADYPIARLVLEFRQMAKLKGTYVEALPAQIRTATGRLHTTFNQTGAATGRLSSVNPNLQNIPIRTVAGREIRSAFVPEEGWKLVVADYSQIELRLLAHMSGDTVLVDAFLNNEDIHTRTASEVFGVAPLMVTSEMRRNAKAVNFGIVYGQTPFGLAQALGISRAEAEIYIKNYFDRYAGVRKWIDATIAEVKRTGYAVTLAGRRRPIPDMDSRNPNARGFAERTAVNTPLQGTAADLIKQAMIVIDRRLIEEGWRSRMLLQVHDELVFEAPPEEAEALAKLAKREMEGVARLAVPLLVETGIGDNWRDAK